VSRAAASLRHRYPLVDQSDVVQEFFKRAASAIRAMSRHLSAPQPATHPASPNARWMRDHPQGEASCGNFATRRTAMAEAEFLAAKRGQSVACAASS
jgi:hypothetical protein